MNGQSEPDSVSLASKIAKLAAELGWNQEDFARHTGLSRQTVQQIFHENGSRRLRNDTVSRCAKALGFTVHELRSSTVERLVLRVDQSGSPRAPLASSQLFDLATQPALRTWLQQNPERARGLTPAEFDELLSLQGTGGPLTAQGVEHFVARQARTRKLIQELHLIAGTEYLDLVEQLFDLICARIQPYRDRA